MSGQNATENPPKSPVNQTTTSSGIRTALRYTGIPPSWLDKRPKFLSRNWLIFLSVTSSTLGLYIYDRRQCKHIRESYIERVKALGEERVSTYDWPRKVTVFGSKWPGDEDYQQGIKYFRKYVKPILVAAAVDYEMISGRRHGDIADRVANDARLRRRSDLGVDHDTQESKALPTYKTPPERRKHELEGGIVLIGRPTFKEFMAGLKRGWSVGLETVDQDEALVHELEDDGHFDEFDDPLEGGENLSSSQTTLSVSASIISPIYSNSTSYPPHVDKQNVDVSLETEHLQLPNIPRLPPLLLVPFSNRIGFTQIPLMIWDFFNHRKDVRSGAEAAYRLIMKHTRPIDIPETGLETPFSDDTETGTQLVHSDLEFDKGAEELYKKSLKSFSSDIEKARKKYYEELPKRLATARALTRGTREATKEEINNPPSTEVELRAERMQKELRWRNDLKGWDIVKPNAKVVWDDRFRDALRIYTDPPQSANSTT